LLVVIINKAKQTSLLVMW